MQQLRLITIVRKNKCFMCNRQVQAWRGKGVSVLPFPRVLCGAGMSLAWQSLGQTIYPKPSETIFLPPSQKAWNYFIYAAFDLSFSWKVLPLRHIGLSCVHWFLTPAASQNLLAQMAGLQTLKFLVFYKQLQYLSVNILGGEGLMCSEGWVMVWEGSPCIPAKFWGSCNRAQLGTYLQIIYFLGTVSFLIQTLLVEC